MKKRRKSKVQEVNELSFYEKGKGCCIGNMVYQIIATFYLNELDHYIYYDLNCKHFARYMDDIYIIQNDKNYLKQCLNEKNIIVNK